jgi:hypothetical protein
MLFFPQINWKLFATVALSLVISNAQSEIKELVRFAQDFNPDPASSIPAGMMVFDDKLCFGASDGAHGSSPDISAN